MRCDDHVINYSSKKTTKVLAACLQSTDGPVTTRSRDRFHARATSHAFAADQMKATKCRFDTERRWKKKLPYCFFISAATSNKDIHHTHSHPPPRFPQTSSFGGDSKSSKTTRAEKSVMLCHVSRKHGDSASILFASVLMANEKRQG